KEWCKKKGIQYGDKAELIKDPEVIKLFNSIVKEFNRSLGKDEQVKRFRIVPDEWTPDSGELSPTLKLKRRILNDKYPELINEIFNKETNTDN
ncbi:MAG: long-chain fatty acid--CoA ligase, partial [Cyclobacteriaceae bacterium]|nr:long-chain fatty acid--CoA ligase [Cyclobacteriaceae bacterium]